MSSGQIPRNVLFFPRMKVRGSRSRTTAHRRRAWELMDTMRDNVYATRRGKFIEFGYARRR